MKTKSRKRMLHCKWCGKEIENRRHEALCTERPAARLTYSEVGKSMEKLATPPQLNTKEGQRRDPEDSPLKKYICLRTCFVWNRYFVKDAIYDIPCEMDIEPKNFAPFEEGG